LSDEVASEAAQWEIVLFNLATRCRILWRRPNQRDRHARDASGLEIMIAVLIALPASRVVGLALRAVIIPTAVMTILRHRDLSYLLPLSVFVGLIALAETLS
jgi:hypothetical protein